MKRGFMVFAVLFSTVASAAREVDQKWATQVVLDKPSCSGDTECTRAMDLLKSQARSKAKSEAKVAATNLCKMLGHVRGELKYLSISEMIPRPEGGSIRFYVSGTLYARCFND
jgi:hypothetical protein